MWQIYGEKETCGTKGGLVSKWKQSMNLVVTTNGEKSAEVIVPRRLQTSWEGLNFRRWARRRIRAVYWKQWKKPRTRYRMLRALKCEHWVAREMIRCRKGYWRMAQVIGSVFKNEIVVKLGYMSMFDYYLIVREN